MQANYKGKQIVYDIDSRTYSDNFSTTFMQDLALCDLFSERTNKDYLTPYCEQVYKEWKNNVRYYTDFIMCLNHRCNGYYNVNKELCKKYAELYEKYDNLAFETFKGEDLEYYIGILD